ncbi:hypothetical protein EBR57_04955 [bacterium]|nr:hypothetical protein [bacterium]
MASRETDMKEFAVAINGVPGAVVSDQTIELKDQGVTRRTLTLDIDGERDKSQLILTQSKGKSTVSFVESAVTHNGHPCVCTVNQRSLINVAAGNTNLRKSDITIDGREGTIKDDRMEKGNRTLDVDMGGGHIFHVVITQTTKAEYNDRGRQILVAAPSRDAPFDRLTEALHGPVMGPTPKESMAARLSRLGAATDPVAAGDVIRKGTKLTDILARLATV